VVAFLFPGKTQERWLCLGGLPSSVPILCLFVPTGKWRNSGKSLNGGHDETRTRDLCCDSQRIAAYTSKWNYFRVARHRRNGGMALIHVPCLADRLSLSEVLNKNDVAI
jgi:hypothetical protein